MDEVDLDRVEFVHLDQLGEVGALQGPGSLTGFEERPYLLDLEEAIDLGHRHLERPSTRVTLAVKRGGAEVGSGARSDLT